MRIVSNTSLLNTVDLNNNPNVGLHHTMSSADRDEQALLLKEH